MKYNNTIILTQFNNYLIIGFNIPISRSSVFIDGTNVFRRRDMAWEKKKLSLPFFTLQLGLPIRLFFLILYFSSMKRFLKLLKIGSFEANHLRKPYSLGLGTEKNIFGNMVNVEAVWKSIFGTEDVSADLLSWWEGPDSLALSRLASIAPRMLRNSLQRANYN